MATINVPVPIFLAGGAVSLLLNPYVQQFGVVKGILCHAAVAGVTQLAFGFVNAEKMRLQSRPTTTGHAGLDQLISNTGYKMPEKRPNKIWAVAMIGAGILGYWGTTKAIEAFVTKQAPRVVSEHKTEAPVRMVENNGQLYACLPKPKVG